VVLAVVVGLRLQVVVVHRRRKRGGPPPLLRFNLHYETPDEVEHLVDPLLRRYAWLVPTWVHDLFVHYTGADKDDPEARAGIIGHWEYREARMDIYGGWLALDAGLRRDSIVHELAHAATEPLHQFVMDLLCKLPDDEKARTKRHWLKLLEGCTQDIAHGIRASEQRKRKPIRI
jgi:hypothetical protein